MGHADCDDAGNMICSGKGTCGRSGLCICDDPYGDFRTMCDKCKPGFALFGGSCVVDSCISGPHKILGCAACLLANSYFCETCVGGGKPNSEGLCPNAKSGGLSGGAIAGIVIAVLVVLAGAGFLVYWFVFRKSGGANTTRIGGKAGYAATNL